MQLHGALATQREARLAIFGSGRSPKLLKIDKIHQQFCLSEIKKRLQRLGPVVSSQF